MKKITLLLAGLCLVIVSMASQAGDNAPLWMRYPAISPDGKYIAFSYQGDIFRVPTQGGKAELLTSHVAYDYAPVWSPDSKTLAFASDRFGNFDIFTMPATGGTPTRLTLFSGNETPASFTPDGKAINFAAGIQDLRTNVQFPSGVLTELYQVPVSGGKIERVLTTPAEQAQYTNDGKYILYQDRKGYEDEWRKHHTSSVTRDLWKYNTETKKHTKLTSYNGEDREPVVTANNEVYYLTEAFNNCFNIAKTTLDNFNKGTQLTTYDKHPVRFLSIANNGTLCYGYNGEIYTLKEGNTPKKVAIEILNDNRENPLEYVTMTHEATEMAVAPNGEEVAFIARGEVFVTSVDYGTTKQITNTPEQERSLSFSPDGRKLLYASERNGSWNLYETKLAREEEEYFALSTLLEEHPVLESDKETFQPAYSPDGKEIAFLEERTTLRVINLDSKKIRTILDGKWNYSYSDGDQWYQWSPDGKWFLVSYSPYNLFSGDVALIDAQGNQQITNLTQSGYSDNAPKWMMNGKMMIWFTDRQGMRSHGSWGAQYDVYGMFFDKEAFEQFKQTKEEAEKLKNDDKDDDKKAEADDKDKDKKKKKDKKDKKDEDELEPLTIDLNNIEDTKVRLTIHSSSISDAVMTPDGNKLYYLSRFERGYDLWMHDFKENETKLVNKLNARGGQLIMDKDGKNLFVFGGGRMMKIAISSNTPKPIHYRAEMTLNKPAERAYMFEHAWRQVKKKFYVENLHGVDWDFYKTEYQRFLPYINNNYDFSEMLSELLGELNASHTGSGYRAYSDQRDNTASLAIFYDFNYEGNGIRITEIMDKSPLTETKKKINSGIIIEKINGVTINNNQDYYKALNRKANEQVLLSFYNPSSKERWDEVVKPISRYRESNMLYERWVETMRQKTEELSNGRIGYVHVKGMNDPSFRQVYEDLFGKNADKEAVVVDTRFNGGGWLHDDLAVLFSGKKYVNYVPRGQHFGHDPMARWIKPTALLMSESNYSDAHGFPYAYATLKIGKTVGMPVPGTMTAVWWETLQDHSLYFGIPQVGTIDMKGDYLENQQLEPDVKVTQDYEEVSKGRDQQLEEAVKVLLEELDAK